MRLQKRPYIRPPKRLLKNPVAWEEAEFYADLYLKAKTTARKHRIIESCLANGGQWDMVTRSLAYYNIFEDKVGMYFPSFWGPTNDYSGYPTHKRGGPVS